MSSKSETLIPHPLRDRPPGALRYWHSRYRRIAYSRYVTAARRNDPFRPTGPAQHLGQPLPRLGRKHPSARVVELRRQRSLSAAADISPIRQLHRGGRRANGDRVQFNAPGTRLPEPSAQPELRRRLSGAIEQRIEMTVAQPAPAPQSADTSSVHPTRRRGGIPDRSTRAAIRTESSGHRTVARAEHPPSRPTVSSRLSGNNIYAGYCPNSVRLNSMMRAGSQSYVITSFSFLALPIRIGRRPSRPARSDATPRRW